MKKFLFLGLLLFVGIVMVVAGFSSQSAKAAPADVPVFWPASYSVEKDCSVAWAVSGVAIGTTYDSGGKTWTLASVNAPVASFGSNGKANVEITFHWTAPDGDTNDESFETKNVEKDASCNPPKPDPVKIDVCHHDEGNGGPNHNGYTINNVSIHSVDDANGLNGHGDHDEDTWASFVFDGVTYPGQGEFPGPCGELPPPPPPVCTNLGSEVLISDSGWVLAGDGLSRTWTKIYGQPDNNYPGTYCNQRPDTKTEYLTKYCVDGQTVDRWPSEMGDAEPGVCEVVTTYTAQVTSANNCDTWSRGYDVFADGVFMSHVAIDSGNWPGSSVPGNSNYQVTLPDQSVVTLALPEMSRPNNCQNPPPHPTPVNTPGNSGPINPIWILIVGAVVLGTLGYAALRKQH